MANSMDDHLPGTSAEDILTATIAVAPGSDQSFTVNADPLLTETELVAREVQQANWPIRFARLMFDFTKSAPFFYVVAMHEGWYRFGVDSEDTILLPSSLALVEEGESKISYIASLELLEAKYEKYKMHRHVRNAVSKLSPDEISTIDRWYAAGNRITKDMKWG